jgi:DNA (cytosine-5)-methyltransferase 1
MISSRTIIAADLFCGAGGTSAGLRDACKQLGYDTDLVAVNHWPVAIATHTASHKFAHHLCENLDNVDPRKVFPGGKIDMLVASPECTHFSTAAGGRVKSDQSRASGWHVLRWAEALRPEAIVVENVPEWVGWSPLDENGYVDPSYEKGSTFKGWVSALEGLGYTVEWKVLCCADFGDVTSRKRLFVMARRDGKIIWPTPTHSKDGDMFTEKWRPAREIIDWDNQGKSIFNRSKPLSQNTQKRIMAGIKKFCPEISEFLVKINGNDEESIKHSPKSVEEPLRTITAGGKHFALVKTNFLVEDGRLKPLVVQIDNHSSKGHNCRTTEEPISTVVSKGRHCLVQPFLSKYYGTGENNYSIDEPVHTVTTKGRHALVEPSIKQGALDIKFRMLTNDELARAHGMGDFDFQGTSAEVTKQIGNSVPRNMAKALCHAQLSH